MKLKNKIVALALVVASAFGLAVSNRATKVEAADYSASYIVASKTSVTATNAPNGSSATFSQTYSSTAGQMTSGNNTILTLKGYQKLEIVGFTLSMKSNSSKGAGSLTVTAGTETIYEIAAAKFNTASWAGKWSTSFIDVTRNLATPRVIGENENLTFTIEATENSLYVQSYTIHYNVSNLSVEEQVAAISTNVQLGLSYYKNTEIVEGEEASSQTVSTVIKSYAESNNWASSTKHANIEMDDNISVTANVGSNTGKYYENGYDWRIYQSESGTVEFTANNGCIMSTIKITYTVDKTGVLTFGGNNIESATAVEVNAATATFGVGNTGTATNGQVRITAIEVVYSSGGPTETITYDTFCNAKLRYVANVPSDLVGDLDFADDQFGFELTLGGKTTEYTLDYANITVEEDDSYTFALIVNVPEEHYKDVVKVRAFVTLVEDGEIAYLDYSIEDFSVKSLAEYYISNNKVTGDEKDALEAFLTTLGA